jgi:hypothetical protein
MTAKKPAPIVIRLTADGLKNVKSALSGASKSVKALASAIGKINTGIKATSKSFAVAGGAVSGLAAAFAATTRAGVESVAEQGRFAQQVGMSAEQYQRLRYAAEQAGQDVDGLNGFLINLADKAADAANGSEGAAQQLADLGISAVDSKGRLKSMPQLVEDLADAVARMPDGAKKTGLLSIFAGDDGARAIGWLNQGSRGLKRMAGEAEALGLVISDEQTAYAQATKRDVDQLFSVVKSVRDELAMVFAPELRYQSQQLTDAILRNKEAIKQLAVDAYNAAWAIGEELYNVLYLKKNPTTGWMQTALDIASDLQTIFSGSGGPLKLDFLENARTSFLDFKAQAEEVFDIVTTRAIEAFDKAKVVLDDFVSEVMPAVRTVTGAIEAADRIVTDFFRLFSGAGGIETGWIRDLEDDWRSFSDTFNAACRNIISPALSAFRGALDGLAALVNGVFGKEGEDRWTGGQIAIAAAIAKITGLASLLGRALLAVSGAAGLAVAGVLAVAGAVKSTSDVAATQEEVAQRVEKISAEQGQAAAAAYQKAYLEQYEQAWGYSAANSVAQFFGLGTDIEATKIQLDAIINADKAGAKLGADLAAQELRIPATVEVQSAEVSDKIAEELSAVEASLLVTDVEVSDDAKKKLSGSLTLSAPGLPGFSGGGAVRGPGTTTSDSVLARLSTGEFVMRAAAVKKWGVGMLSALNSGILPAFASGGLVSMPAPAGISSASAMLGGSSGRPVLLQLPDGSTTELRGQPDAVAQLERKLRRSVTAQATRKPGWYK